MVVLSHLIQRSGDEEQDKVDEWDVGAAHPKPVSPPQLSGVGPAESKAGFQRILCR